jgi:hypothetical protein
LSGEGKEEIEGRGFWPLGECGQRKTDTKEGHGATKEEFEVAKGIQEKKGKSASLAQWRNRKEKRKKKVGETQKVEGTCQWLGKLNLPRRGRSPIRPTTLAPLPSIVKGSPPSATPHRLPISSSTQQRRPKENLRSLFPLFNLITLPRNRDIPKYRRVVCSSENRTTQGGKQRENKLRGKGMETETKKKWSER